VVAESLENVQNAMQSTEWASIERKFQAFTTNFSVKVVHFREGFQV
jgi:hypothetical protein